MLLARAKAQKAARLRAQEEPPNSAVPGTPTHLDSDITSTYDSTARLAPAASAGDPTRQGFADPTAYLDPADDGSAGVPTRLGFAVDSGELGAVVTAGTTGVRRLVPAPRTTEVRVQQALDTASVDRVLPTLPAVSELLDGPGLRGGSTYSVRGSSALMMAMMAGPSAEGAWCGVVGLPSFGAEAARGLGVDLDRLVLVPDPERDWLNVVAALVDALTVVVVRPPSEVTPGEASRLAARLRTRGAVLIAVGSWPGSEVRLEVESNTWTGLGSGEGMLAARQATVVVTGRRAAVRQRKHQLWLPGPDGTIRSVDSVSDGSIRSVESVGQVREDASHWQDEAVG
jgi:hypothetical protein